MINCKINFKVDLIMEAFILKLTPSTWDKYETNASKQFTLSNNSEEYKTIESEVIKAVPNNILISSIERYQNLYDYGQLLIREQLKVNLYPLTSFYRVRRYINIKTQFLRNALEYNLDHRRCSLSTLNFRRQLPVIKNDETIFVVQVVTDSPYGEIITPDSSSDYYIEYIIYQKMF